jgi:uncharacterized protein (TIGR03437 family)
VADPATAGLVYAAALVDAAAADGPVWKSVDGGANWKKSSNGLPQTAGSLILFPRVLYFRTGFQLFKSVDQGANWTLQSTLPVTDAILAIAPSNPNRMYAGSISSANIYASSNEGKSWNATANVGSSQGRNQLQGMGVLPGDSETVFATVETIFIKQSGAYRSTNGGVIFLQEPADGLGSVTSIFGVAGGPVYATGLVTGFSRSLDNGKTWKAVGAVGQRIVGYDPASPLTVYGNTGTGLARSLDGWNTWTELNPSLTPSIGRPTPLVRITIEEGASYSQPIPISVAEDPAWKLPFSLSVSDPSRLGFSANAGTTPASVVLTATTADLKPGIYSYSFNVDSPQSFNKSVTVPVQVQILPAGTSGPRYDISTVLGNGQKDVTALTGSATGLAIGTPGAIAVDRQDRLYVYQAGGFRVWQASNGTAKVFAGTGTKGDSGDGGSATDAQINFTVAIATDAQNNVYLSSGNEVRYRKIVGSTMSTLVSVANSFVGHRAVTIDSQGRLTANNVGQIARLNGTTFTNVAVTSIISGFNSFNVTRDGMTADTSGNLYFSERDNNRVYKMNPLGEVTLIAGNRTAGFSGDGGPAQQAQLNTPTGVAVDGQGNIFILDQGNARIRMVTAAGVIYTIAGNGSKTSSGDGGPAALASFDPSGGIAVDSQGNLYVSDPIGFRVRMLKPAGGTAPRLDAISQASSGDPRLSPGSLFALYGNFDVGDGLTLNSAVPWPGSMKGVTVYVNGVIAPLYGILKSQINGQIPYETATGQATLVVTVNGSIAKTLTFPVVPANPGVLIFGNSRALAVNQNGSVNTPDTPASPGDFEVLYFSGIGIPDHPVPTGFGAPGVEPLARAQYPYAVKINGQVVNTIYLGLAPTFPALAQTNFQVPGLPPGDYDLVVSVNGVDSNVTRFTIGAK